MNFISAQLLYIVILFFITKFDDILTTTIFDTLIEIVIARFDTSIKVIIVTFDASTKIVIVESALLITSEVIITKIVASNAIADVVTILLKTRLI